MSTAGKIYILRNPYFQDSLVKIGKTSRISEARAKKLSKATGVPGPFEVLYEEDVFNVDLAEKLAHESLDTYRTTPNREFFQLPLKIAVREVATIAWNMERIQKGYADPRIVILMNGHVDATNVKRLIEPYRGGDTYVSVFYSNGNAAAVFDLGDNWRIKFSVAFIRDLKKYCKGLGMAWVWGAKDKSRQEFDLENEVPF